MRSLESMRCVMRGGRSRNRRPRVSRMLRCLIGIAAILLPAVALAQEGQIAGPVRDTSGGVIPGVTVEATSPALIEKVRTTTSDANGQYRLTNLPVGTYTVTFTLGGVGTQRHDNSELSSGV